MSEEQFPKDKKPGSFGSWPGETFGTDGSIEDLIEGPDRGSALRGEADRPGPPESPLEYRRFEPAAETPFELRDDVPAYRPHPIDRSMETPLEFPRRDEPAVIDPDPEPERPNWEEPAPSEAEIAAMREEQERPYTNFEDPFDDVSFVPVDYVPETADETVRNSGLAWSAGIAFFSSVAFMLFLGWIADLLLGTKPWGIVGGIILGSVIGFIQFFRISSQIFGSREAKDSPRSLMNQSDDDDLRFK